MLVKPSLSTPGTKPSSMGSQTWVESNLGET